MTLTVTTSVPFGDTPRIQINITSSPTVNGSVVLWRTHTDGTVHRVLLEANPTMLGTYVGLDFHAPFNQAVTYRAEAAGLVSAESGAQWLISDESWLVHRSDPDLSVVVEKLVGPAAPYKYPSRATRFQVLNRRLPVYRTDYPRGGESGQLLVKCESEASRAALKALLADDGVLLLNTPYTDDDLGWKWIKPLDLDISNPGGSFNFPFRYATIPYEEASQPDADSTLWTWADMTAHAVAAYPTWADLTTAYAGKTWDDLTLKAV
jgi:hypothetical protein